LQVVLYYEGASCWTCEEEWMRPKCKVAPGVEVIARLSREECEDSWSEISCNLREPEPWSALSSAAQRAFSSLDLGPYRLKAPG
jgi:hypothetical protein